MIHIQKTSVNFERRNVFSSKDIKHLYFPRNMRVLKHIYLTVFTLKFMSI